MTNVIGITGSAAPNSARAAFQIEAATVLAMAYPARIATGETSRSQELTRQRARHLAGPADQHGQHGARAG
jgi:hypothetical protein